MYNIKTILFDLDNTLRFSQPSPNQRFFDFAVTLGLDGSPRKRREALRWSYEYWANSPELVLDRVLEISDETEFWTNYARRYLEAMGVKREKALESAPLIHEHMRDYHPENIVPEEAHAVLTALKDANYAMGLITNRSNPLGDELHDLGIAAYFDVAYAACEVGAWKPDPIVFDRALEVTGSTPEETVYIGDNPYADVLGAQRAGITPVLYDPEGLFPETECEIIPSLSDAIPLFLDGRNA